MRRGQHEWLKLFKMPPNVVYQKYKIHETADLHFPGPMKCKSVVLSFNFQFWNWLYVFLVFISKCYHLDSFCWCVWRLFFRRQASQVSYKMYQNERTQNENGLHTHQPSLFSHWKYASLEFCETKQKMKYDKHATTNSTLWWKWKS